MTDSPFPNIAARIDTLDPVTKALLDVAEKASSEALLWNEDLCDGLQYEQLKDARSNLGAALASLKELDAKLGESK